MGRKSRHQKRSKRSCPFLQVTLNCVLRFKHILAPLNISRLSRCLQSHTHSSTWLVLMKRSRHFPHIATELSCEIVGKWRTSWTNLPINKMEFNLTKMVCRLFLLYPEWNKLWAMCRQRCRGTGLRRGLDYLSCLIVSMVLGSFDVYWTALSQTVLRHGQETAPGMFPTDNGMWGSADGAALPWRRLVDSPPQSLCLLVYL